VSVEDQFNYDTELFREDQDKRRHTENMARINMEAAKRRREDRQPIWLGAAVVGVVLTLIAAVWTGVDRQNASDRKTEQIRQSTAQHCIDAGDVWINNNCVPAAKK